jgi:hypothetical protein
MLAAVCIILQSCRFGNPGPEQAENAVRAALDGGSEERLRLGTFEKVDGRSAEVSGVKLYTLMFKADVQFLTDAMFSVGTTLTKQGTSITTNAGKQESSSISWNDFAIASQGNPARLGDVLHLTGSVDFEKRESGWVPVGISFNVAQDSSHRGQLATLSANPDGPSTKGAGPSLNVSQQRCADFAVAHAPPKPSIRDRLLRRAQLPTLPDSGIYIGVRGVAAPDTSWLSVINPDGSAYREESAGRIAYLQTGEICVGPTNVLALSDITTQRQNYYVIVSRPFDASGYRLLRVSEIDGGLAYAWIIHSDSTRPLSDDLLRDYHVYPDGSPAPGMSQMQIYHFATVSPDKRFIIMQGGNEVESGLFVVNLADRTAHFISIRGFLPTAPQNECRLTETAQMDSVKWIDQYAFQVPIAYVDNSEVGFSCPKPWEMKAALSVDVTKYSATRVR